MAPDDSTGSYEVKWLVCARNWTLFTTLLTCNPEPQAHAPEWCLVEPVHQYLTEQSETVCGSNSTDPCYSINSLLGASKSLRLEMSWNTGEYDPLMNELILCSTSFNSYSTEKTVWLEPKTNKPLICTCVNQALQWMGQMKVFIVSLCLCKMRVRWNSWLKRTVFPHLPEVVNYK